ncbi:MAG: hypothetical protein JO052_15645, partial [Bradyrhizobium sp.]|nr:hypothetical protein [Bradyrhizobium sp.]
MLVLVAASAGMLATPVCAAAGEPADAIAVEGNRRVDPDTVRSYFHASPAGQYDAAALDAALKDLYATGQFDD